MKHLKDFMSVTMFYEILSSLDYVHMNDQDKKFISKLYEKYKRDKDNMEMTDHQYAKLNDIDFMQNDYFVCKDFDKQIRP